jgi:maltooligosyltrehalose trehalohydrolase
MGARYAFERSWGAELIPGAGARFRLWAPTLNAISLIAVKSGISEPMIRSEDGWFELSTDLIRPGTGYMFQLPDGMRVPDPAARAQVGNVHGPSILVDPRAYDWKNGTWQGRPWEEAIVYELHTGTFTDAGTFVGIESRLDYLVELGVTAVELMPVAQFSGNRGWGYDGVLLYAPHIAYGGPRGLKRLIDASHARGLMVILDVVYNHFGPDGNYLHAYAPEFFHHDDRTPWGAAIAYDLAPVRAFFVDNVLYWLEEYRFDGLRLDAIDQIRDESLLDEIAHSVRSRVRDRPVHLTTEDERNIVSLHQRLNGIPVRYTGEWNDDFHHAAHVIATGESDGYYCDYSDAPIPKFARALAEGYVYQGEPSVYRDGKRRGEPSVELSPIAFINFLQNHDQVGNRAFGERLTSLAPPEAVDALLTVLFLSPQIPLLFMGEEWGETRPFYFFTDFSGELGEQVREGRCNEFRRWQSFQNPENRRQIPDPNAVSTFVASKIDWNKLSAPSYIDRLNLVRRLLEIRKREIVPRLEGILGNTGTVLCADTNGLAVQWCLSKESVVLLLANLSGNSWRLPVSAPQVPRGKLIYETVPGLAIAVQSGTLPPWSVVVTGA